MTLKGLKKSWKPLDVWWLFLFQCIAIDHMVYVTDFLILLLTAKGALIVTGKARQTLVVFSLQVTILVVKLFEPHRLQQECAAPGMFLKQEYAEVERASAALGWGNLPLTSVYSVKPLYDSCGI